MELSDLIKIAYNIPDEIPDNVDYIACHSFDGEVKVPDILDEITYYFVSRWTESVHKRRDVVFIISDRGTGSFESICLPANETIKPIIIQIGKLCGISDEVDNIMKSMGYDG